MKVRSQSQHDIKINNAKLVLRIIRNKEDKLISRAKIAEITKMSPTSISRITDSLISFGLIKETGTISNIVGAGRRGTNLEVSEDAILTVGIDIDSDYIDMCILNFVDEIILSKRVDLEEGTHEPIDVIQIAHEIYQDLYSQIPYRSKNVTKIGISIVGNVDYPTGIVNFSPQFNWTNVELAKIAEDVFKLPVTVENDVKSTLIGLAHPDKELRDKNITYLTIGTGVGSAIMYSGSLIRGTNNAAGEIGHLILGSGTQKCDCGQYGCVQTYLTKGSLVAQFSEEVEPVNNIYQIYEKYRNKDDLTTSFVNNQAKHFAMLIRNLVYMYDTGYILVGGSIPQDFPEIYDLALEKLPNLMHENLYKHLNIQLTEIPKSNGTGAAFIAQKYYLEEYFNSVSL